MTVRIWQSYACNNSSSYRLVARFADAATARAAAAELSAFFVDHAAQLDAREGWSREPSQAQRELAARYGFSWTEAITWGDEALTGDEPDLIVHDDTLVIFHSYCGGGLGDGVPKVLRAKGGTIGTPERGDLEVSVLFLAAPGANAKLDEELAEMFADFDEQDDEPDEPDAPWVEPVPVPWDTKRESYGHVAVFRDASTVGLHVAIDPRDLETVSRYLAAHQIAKSSIQLDVPANRRVFRAIRKARCTSCEGPLEYLDPRLHDIEAPQLVCKPCGGLYELGAFL